MAEQIDPAQAEAAFTQLQDSLEALPPAALRPVLVDVQAAAVVALGIGLRDNASPRREGFEGLAKAGQFDLSHLEGLPGMALGAWHARRRQLLSSATDSSAAVSEAVVVPAQKVRGRMLKLAEHYFGDDAEVGPTVAAIRSGTGYQDLASDLQALADLFGEPRVHAIVERDPVFYEPGDAQAARTHAGAILTELGFYAAGEAERWTDLTQRAWTLLSASYDEVRAAGEFLFRKDGNSAESYPSLISAVRNPRKKAPPTPEAPVAAS